MQAAHCESIYTLIGSKRCYDELVVTPLALVVAVSVSLSPRQRLVLDMKSRYARRVRGLHVQGDGLARQRLDVDLHAAAEAHHQVKGPLLLNVVVQQVAAVLGLTPAKIKRCWSGLDALLVMLKGLNFDPHFGT